MSSSQVRREYSLVGSNPPLRQHYPPPSVVVQLTRLSLTDDTRQAYEPCSRLTDPICYPRGLAVIPSVHLAVQAKPVVRAAETRWPCHVGSSFCVTCTSSLARPRELRQSIARSVRNWKPRPTPAHRQNPSQPGFVRRPRYALRSICEWRCSSHLLAQYGLPSRARPRGPVSGAVVRIGLRQARGPHP